MNCPVCKAGNDAGPNCRRCKADLALLFQLEEQRDRAMQSARHCLAEGRIPRALGYANGADALRRGRDSQLMLALGHLLLDDFADARQCLQSAASLEALSAGTANR